MKKLGTLLVILLLSGCAAAEPLAQEVVSETQSARPDPNDAQLNPAPEDSGEEAQESQSASPAPEESAEASVEPTPTQTAKPTATPKATATPKPTATPEPTVTAGPVFVSRAEVAKNNSRSSCWVNIDGSVYDLTKWIAQHPGGASNILNLCGTDGSSAFSGMHGGEARPSSVLQNYFFAELEN